MHFYEWLSCGFYIVFALLARHHSLNLRRRTLVTAIALAGCGGIVAAAFQWPDVVIRNWLPIGLIPMAYWQTGQFVRPMNEAFQIKLQSFDQKLLLALGRSRGDSWARGPMSIGLEIGYLLCYPMVPCGLAALYLTGREAFVTEFWNIVIPPAYACYATFPFVQTPPPRAVEHHHQWQPQQTPVRTLNLFVLRHVSIHANTFPSGHVAASLAIALELMRLAPRVGVVFLAVAISIAAGAFLGRYHYALDVLAGAALAATSFLVVLLLS